MSGELFGHLLIVQSMRDRHIWCTCYCTEYLMLRMFSKDTEKVQLILVQFFAADVGSGFLLIPVIVGLEADWSSQNSL